MTMEDVDTQDQQDPQVPAGFAPVDQGSQDPPPPPGFTPVAPTTPPPPPAGQQAPQINPVQPPDDSDPVENFKRQHPWSQTPLNIFQGVGSGILSTARNIDQLGNRIAPSIFAPSEIPESYTKAPPGWAGTAGHWGEQLAEFFLPAGKVGEVNKAIDASLTAGPWVKAGAKAIVEATPAYGITLAQTGDPNAARNAALLAGGTSVVLPKIGQLLKHYYGAVTGVGSDVVGRVAEQPTADLMAAMTGQVSEAEILEATRQAVRNLAQKRSADYVARLNQLPSNIAVDLTPARRTLNDLANQFRIRRILNPQTQKIELDFGNSHLWSDPAAQQQITALWDKVMSPMANNPRNVDALKRGVDAMYGESNQSRAVVEGVRDALANSLNKSVPGYQAMTAEYAKASDFLAELKDLSLQAGKTNNDGTAMRKLFTSLKQNNDYRKGLMEELAAYTPKDITGMVAGNRMSSWTPRGIVAALHAAGTGLAPGAFLHAAAHDPAALAVSLASIFGVSPRMVGEIAARSQTAGRLITTGAGAAPSMLRITGQQPDYDANAEQNLLGRKKGGFLKLSTGGVIRMDGGGTLDDDASDSDPNNDPTLRRIKQQRMIQLSQNPGQFSTPTMLPQKMGPPMAPPPRYQDPVAGFLGQSADRMVGGWQHLWEPSDTTAADPNWWDKKAQATSDVFRGAGPFLAPLAIPAAAAAPIPAAVGLVAGTSAGLGGEALAQKAGMPSGQAALFGDLSGLAAGIVAPQFAPTAETIKAAPGAVRNWINQLDYTGGDPERGSTRLWVPGRTKLADINKDYVVPVAGSRLNKLDVMNYVQGQVQRHFGAIDPDAPPNVKLQRLLKIGRSELADQLSQAKPNLDFYIVDSPQANADMVQMFPELANDSARMNLVKAASAALAQGSNPGTEAQGGGRAYNYYRQYGVLPEVQPNDGIPGSKPGKQWSTSAGSLPIQKLNRFIEMFKSQQDPTGLVTLERIMTGRYPVGFLQQINPNVGGKMGDMVPGAMILGPKIGSYFLDISGIPQDGATVDMWDTLGQHRRMGNMFSRTGKPIVTPSITNRQIFQDFHGTLENEFGLDRTQSQSGLWHYEKELYKRLGVPTLVKGRSDGTKSLLDAWGHQRQNIITRQNAPSPPSRGSWIAPQIPQIPEEEIP
jgi:hypothetical protein